MIESEEIISRIQNANKLADVLDVNNISSEYKNLMKKIHPDVCQHSGAGEATSKLFQLKEDFQKGISYMDDAGEFKTNGYFLHFTGDADLMKQSYDNYTILKNIHDDAAHNFHKYMPESMRLNGKNLEITFDKRAVPISGLTLPQEHVNWVLSRMLEYSAWLSQIGYVHGGINPESIFIVPETHGIQVCSFYHMTKIGGNVSTISGKYQSWYPSNLFSSKKSSSTVDLELSKKTAIYLLGDQSGSGIKLRKTHNESFMDFVISQDHDAHEAFSNYRNILKGNFEKKFYPLYI